MHVSLLHAVVPCLPCMCPAFTPRHAISVSFSSLVSLLLVPPLLPSPRRPLHLGCHRSSFAFVSFVVADGSYWVYGCFVPFFSRGSGWSSSIDLHRFGCPRSFTSCGWFLTDLWLLRPQFLWGRTMVLLHGSTLLRSLFWGEEDSLSP